jgi:hypothetical protein
MKSVLTDGQSGSASQVSAALGSLRGYGQNLYEDLQQKRQISLVDLERRLSALNARQRRANALLPVGVAAAFSVGDFSGIQQGESSATVRIDTQAATLKERRTDVLSLISQQKFSSSSGTIEQLDMNGTLMRVRAEAGVIPTGVFNLTLQQAVVLGVVTFDLAAMASSPQAIVEVSENGMEWRPAVHSALFGYRVVAWLDSFPVLYLRLTLTPTHPDSLGGQSYTFGLTQFSGQGLEFQLRSELMSQPVVFPTTALNLNFQADADPGLAYYLSLSAAGTTASFQNVQPGDSVATPGMAAVTLGPLVPGTGGLLTSSLPGDLYPDTLRVTDVQSGVSVPVVFDLDPSATPRLQVASVVDGADLYLLPYGIPDQTRQFQVTYRHGPSQFSACLKVVLSTSQASSSPVFRGARLEEL